MWMWAGHTIAARLSVGEMSPMVMMGLRWFACLAILAFIFRHRLAAEWPRVRARLGWVAAMGVRLILVSRRWYTIYRQPESGKWRQ